MPDVGLARLCAQPQVVQDDLAKQTLSAQSATQRPATAAAAKHSRGRQPSVTSDEASIIQRCCRSLPPHWLTSAAGEACTLTHQPAHMSS